MRSPISLVLVEAGTGRRAFLGLRDEDVDVALTEADEALVGQADYLHLDGWYADAAIPAARHARSSGVQVSLDAYRLDERTPEWVSLSDVLIATETFPGRFTGTADLEQACDELLGRGPWLVVTTLGKRGCYVRTRELHFYSPGFEIEPVDTTGCGDVFHGAFLYGLLQDWPLPRIARFSNAAGALIGRGYGGREALPSLAEIHAFIEERSEFDGTAGNPSERDGLDNHISEEV
jgi:ribokinase